MATTKSLKEAIDKKQLAPQTGSIESLLALANVRKRFNDVLGKKAPGFVSSIISLVNSSQNLQAVDPRSVLASAAIAASLDLPVNPSLSFAHIVPYKGRAQFQMGWRGYVQLGIRTGQYKTMNTSDVYEDELESWNPITGEFKLTDPAVWRQREAGEADKVVGYVAFFKLLNGFEKSLFMTVAQLQRHGKKFSKSYDNPDGKWKSDFPAMALKTVLRLLLSKYGVLSIEMQTALKADQAVVTEAVNGDVMFDYDDNPDQGKVAAPKDTPALAEAQKAVAPKAETLPNGAVEDNTDPVEDPQIPFGE